MRAVIQRVSSASVSISRQARSSIRHGFMVLVGVDPADTDEDIDWLCAKIVNLRVFNDANGRMNRSLVEVGGEILVVSQFTLFASTRKGHRPSFSRAAVPEIAVPRYDSFVRKLSEVLGRPVATGEFGADMQVALVNDGPVTLFIDTRHRE